MRGACCQLDIFQLCFWAEPPIYKVGMLAKTTIPCRTVVRTGRIEPRTENGTQQVTYAGNRDEEEARRSVFEKQNSRGLFQFFTVHVPVSWKLSKTHDAELGGRAPSSTRKEWMKSLWKSQTSVYRTGTGTPSITSLCLWLLGLRQSLQVDDCTWLVVVEF